jgi:rSAM-partnered protein
MAESTKRYRVSTQPRDAVGEEWEVFTRNEEDAPLRHVGSVSAPTAEIAHEQATKLFGWHATDIWLCPATDVRRYATHTLDERATPADVEANDDGPRKA